MAIMTSFEKNFEITALSFSPAVILPDQETAFSITVKNTSGKKITSMRADMGMYYAAEDGTVHKSTTVTLYGGSGFDFQSISWAANASKTFTGTFKLLPLSAYPMDSDTRIVPLFKGSDVGYPESYGGDETLGLMLDFTTNATFTDGSNSDLFFNLRGENSEYLVVLDAKYQPAITLFDAERSAGVDPNDEGENLLATLALATSAAAKPENLSLELRYRARGDSTAPINVIDITSVMTDALEDTIVTLINDLFEKNTDWDVTLWFGDQYENATAAIVVSRAFANVHLSGASTGGVCFGAFSQATEDNPLFQCYYPTHFYAPVKFHAGIEGGNDYVLGEVATGGHWIDGKPIYRFVFTTTVSSNGTLTLGKLPSTPETIVSKFGVMKQPNGAHNFLPNVYYGSSSWTIGYYINENDEIILQSGSGYSGTRTITIILEYTKTTDAEVT